MSDSRLDAYLVPSQDPHQSEYVAPHWQARAWLTGFTGSAGTAVVTQQSAGMWTDSRYFLQAEQQLAGSGFQLHRLSVPYTAEHLDWLCEQLPEGARVGCDSRVYAVAQARQAERQLGKHGIALVYCDELIDELWQGRPPLPNEQAFELELAYTGRARAAKLTDIREKMNGLDHYLVTALDEIAWALNIRGKDVPCNPVCISYLLIGKTEAHWFVAPDKVPAALKEQLRSEGIQQHSYRALSGFLAALPPDELTGYSPATTSMYHYSARQEEQWKPSANLIAPLKALRNPTEQQQLQQAMRKDGLALLRLCRWLQKQLNEGNTVTEYELGLKLAGFRAEQPHYFGESFPAIVGYAGNGAIVHYQAEAGQAAAIKAEGILLLDSGGQYLEGTTDITRTFALGPVSEAFKEQYTRVLKGYIALSSAIFPHGTTGVQLDILARQHLWAAGLNYGHGTGHGVGHFLNVHEGPQGITPNPRNDKGQQPILPGMLLSNEPGFYQPGTYGIRIENLERCVEKQLGAEGEKYYGFEPQTLFPISTQPIKMDLLTQQERAWLNEYHARVFQELSPLLGTAEREWLAEQCAEI